MYISLFVGYSIRTLLYLAERSGWQSSKDMAKGLGISCQYMFTILSGLREKELLHVQKGCNGGYQLSRPPKHIKMIDVIYEPEKLDSSKKMGAYSRYKEIEHSAYENGEDIEGIKRIQGLCQYLQQGWIELLRDMTLQHLIDGEFDMHLQSDGRRLKYEG